MKKFSEFIGSIREAEAAQKSDLQKSYQDYFKKKLEKFGVSSPADLDDEKKKEFFNEISADWESGKGVKESELPAAPEAKVEDGEIEAAPDAQKQAEPVKAEAAKEDETSSIEVNAEGEVNTEEK